MSITIIYLIFINFQLSNLKKELNLVSIIYDKKLNNQIKQNLKSKKLLNSQIFLQKHRKSKKSVNYPQKLVTDGRKNEALIDDKKEPGFFDTLATNSNINLFNFIANSEKKNEDIKRPAYLPKDKKEEVEPSVDDAPSAIPDELETEYTEIPDEILDCDFNDSNIDTGINLILRVIFDRQDADHSGTIFYEEMAQFLIGEQIIPDDSGVKSHIEQVLSNFADVVESNMSFVSIDFTNISKAANILLPREIAEEAIDDEEISQDKITCYVKMARDIIKNDHYNGPVDKTYRPMLVRNSLEPSFPKEVETRMKDIWVAQGGDKNHMPGRMWLIRMLTEASKPWTWQSLKLGKLIMTKAFFKVTKEEDNFLSLANVTNWNMFKNQSDNVEEAEPRAMTLYKQISHVNSESEIRQESIIDFHMFAEYHGMYLSDDQYAAVLEQMNCGEECEEGVDIDTINRRQVNWLVLQGFFMYKIRPANNSPFMEEVQARWKSNADSKEQENFEISQNWIINWCKEKFAKIESVQTQRLGLLMLFKAYFCDIDKDDSNLLDFAEVTKMQLESNQAKSDEDAKKKAQSFMAQQWKINDEPTLETLDIDFQSIATSWGIQLSGPEKEQAMIDVKQGEPGEHTSFTSDEVKWLVKQGIRSAGIKMDKLDQFAEILGKKWKNSVDAEGDMDYIWLIGWLEEKVLKDWTARLNKFGYLLWIKTLFTKFDVNDGGTLDFEECKEMQKISNQCTEDAACEAMAMSFIGGHLGLKDQNVIKASEIEFYTYATNYGLYMSTDEQEATLKEIKGESDDRFISKGDQTWVLKMMLIKLSLGDQYLQDAVKEVVKGWGASGKEGEDVDWDWLIEWLHKKQLRDETAALTRLAALLFQKSVFQSVDIDESEELDFTEVVKMQVANNMAPDEAAAEKIALDFIGGHTGLRDEEMIKQSEVDFQTYANNIRVMLSEAEFAQAKADLEDPSEVGQDIIKWTLKLGMRTYGLNQDNLDKQIEIVQKWQKKENDGKGDGDPIGWDWLVQWLTRRISVEIQVTPEMEHFCRILQYRALFKFNDVSGDGSLSFSEFKDQLTNLKYSYATLTFKAIQILGSIQLTSDAKLLESTKLTFPKFMEQMKEFPQDQYEIVQKQFNDDDKLSKKTNQFCLNVGSKALGMDFKLKPLLEEIQKAAGTTQGQGIEKTFQQPWFEDEPKKTARGANLFDQGPLQCPTPSISFSSIARVVFERILLLRIDEDHDGIMTFDEFAKMLVTTGASENKEQAERKAVSFFAGHMNKCSQEGKNMVCSPEDEQFLRTKGQITWLQYTENIHLWDKLQSEMTGTQGKDSVEDLLGFAYSEIKGEDTDELDYEQFACVVIIGIRARNTNQVNYDDKEYQLQTSVLYDQLNMTPDINMKKEWVVQTILNDSQKRT